MCMTIWIFRRFEGGGKNPPPPPHLETSLLHNVQGKKEEKRKKIRKYPLPIKNCRTGQGKKWTNLYADDLISVCFIHTNLISYDSRVADPDGVDPDPTPQKDR